MARAIWSGSISFGLVNVPVKLFPAVRPQDVHFNQFEEGTGARIQYKRVSEKSGDEVPWEHIVKGYEVSKGTYVMVTRDELEGVAPEATHTIDIEDFVSLDEIDPIYYEHTYYLVPAGRDAGAGKGYRLLLAAMEAQNKVAIGRIVIRTKQYLAALRPLEGALAVSTMLFTDKVVSSTDVDDLPDGKDARVTKREVDMAAQIIETLTTDWDPSRYQDTYRERVLDLIERKGKGEEIEVEEPPAETGKVVDLLEALEASVAAAKGRTRGGTGGGTATKPRRRETARRGGRQPAKGGAKPAHPARATRRKSA